MLKVLESIISLQLLERKRKVFIWIICVADRTVAKLRRCERNEAVPSFVKKNEVEFHRVAGAIGSPVDSHVSGRVPEIINHR